METEQARKGLARILEICSPGDVKKFLESKFPRVLPDSKSKDDATKAILKNVQKPSEILCHKNIRRDVIVSYLKEIGVRVHKEQSKDACIKICLNKWHVKDDNFWAKRPRSEGVLGDISRLDNYIYRKTEEGSGEHCLKKNKLMKISKPTEKENIFPRLEIKERDVEEVQVLSPKHFLANSLAGKPSNSAEKSLVRSPPPADSITEQTRESTSLTVSTHISCDAVDLFGELSTSLSDSSDSHPDVSEPERNQSISPSLIPSCSSAPMHHNNQRQSTLSLKTPNPFSADLHSQMMLSEQSSIEPPNFSPQLLNMKVPSMCVMENEFESITDTPTLSSVSSHWISDVERESPELPSTQPFTIPMEMDNPPRVSIVEDERKPRFQPSASSISFRCIYREEERESSKVTQTSTPRLLAYDPPVSNASVQTLLSGPPELQSFGFAVSHGYQNRIWSAKNDKELPESQENLCPRGTVNHKRRLPEHPENKSALSYHKNRIDSSPLPERKGYADGISYAKSRWALPSNPEDNAPAFRNVNRRESNFTECPNCKKRYSPPFLYTDRKELAVSSKSQYYKKKRPSLLLKNVGSSEKQQRLSMTSKRVKGTFSASHESRRPSASVPKVKTYKRKYPSPSPSKETSPLRDSRCQSTFSSKQPCYTSSLSTVRHKQTTLPFKNIYRNLSTIETNEDKDLSKFSTDCLPVENPAEEITDPRPRSASATPKLSSLRKSKSADFTPEASSEGGNPPSESPRSDDSDKHLARPKRSWCTLM